MKTSILDVLIAVLTVVVVVLLVEGFVLLATIIASATVATIIVSIKRDKFTLTVQKSTFDRFALLSYCLFCFVYFASIPKFLFLPVAPKYPLLILTIGLIMLSKKTARYPNLYSLTGPIVLFFIATMLYAFLLSKYVSIVAPLEVIVLMAVTIMIVGGDERRCIMLTRLFAMFTVFSALWFLGSLLFYDPFMLIRKFVYASFVHKYVNSMVLMERPTGLTFSHHIMGYQMAAGVVLVGCLSVAEKSRAWRRLWMLIIPVMIVAFFFTDQRSTALAIVFAFAGYALLILRRKMRLVTQRLILGVILSVIVLYGINMTSFGNKTFKKLSTRPTQKSELPSRLGWQIAAAEIVLETPLGMKAEGKSWGAESLRKGADYSAYGGKVQAVHNGYLLIMLKYGWIGAFFVMVILWFLARNILWITRNVSTSSVSGGYAIAVTFALIALLLQPLFHHGSLFTNETTSCLVLSLFLVWVNILRKKEQPSRRRGEPVDCNGGTRMSSLGESLT